MSAGVAGRFHGADAGIVGSDAGIAAETSLASLDCHKKGKHPIASNVIAMGNSCFMKRLFGFCERKPLRRAEQKDNEPAEVRALRATDSAGILEIIGMLVHVNFTRWTSSRQK